MTVSEDPAARLRGIPDAPTVPDTPDIPGVVPPKAVGAVRTGGAPTAPPISQPRVDACLDSARFWAEILAYHADGLQKRADTWSISAGLLAAVAGLSAWKLVTDQTTSSWAIVLTSGLALAAAISALVPRIKNYAENAALSRELSARYGQSTGVLTDTVEWMKSHKADEAVVRSAVADFESIKKSKDSMRYVPIRSDQTMNAFRRRKSSHRNKYGRRVLIK